MSHSLKERYARNVKNLTGASVEVMCARVALGSMDSCELMLRALEAAVADEKIRRETTRPRIHRETL